MLMWSTTTVPVNGAMFRPDHIVLLAECSPVPHTVIDINNGMTTCDYDHCTAGDDDFSVANNASR